jgi:hypothetical protein
VKLWGWWRNEIEEPKKVVDPFEIVRVIRDLDYPETLFQIEILLHTAKKDYIIKIGEQIINRPERVDLGRGFDDSVIKGFNNTWHARTKYEEQCIKYLDNEAVTLDNDTFNLARKCDFPHTHTQRVQELMMWFLRLPGSGGALILPDGPESIFSIRTQDIEVVKINSIVKTEIRLKRQWAG